MVKEAKEKEETDRLGTDLGLREDVYAWAFVTTFAEEHLVDVLFTSVRK